MEMIDAIKSRRAVREYSDTPVTRETIQRLTGAAILAPSAMNLQPWAFAAILDRDAISGYAKRIRDWLLANFSQTSLPPSLRTLIEPESYNVLHNAPAMVLVLAKSMEPQASEDCCLPAENLMLAARDEGLGTCWIGLSRPWFNLQTTKHELGLPEHYEESHPLSWATRKHGQNRTGAIPPRSIGYDLGRRTAHPRGRTWCVPAKSSSICTTTISSALQ
jgi:nitroreductase